MLTAPSSNKRIVPPAERKSVRERFQAMNEWVRKRGGWIVSIPGEQPAIVECLPESFLLTELSEAGYEVTPLAPAERILPAAIVQRFTMLGDGTQKAITADSTLPVSMTVTNAGIAKTYRFSFIY